MAAAKRKVQKINVLEACLCNFSTIFLAGFLLGFGMTVLVFLPHAAPGLLAKQAPAHRSAVTFDLSSLVAVKNIAANLTSVKNLQESMKVKRSGMLQRRVRILCWVMTANGTSNKLKALTIKRTWGRRCERILFFAEIADPDVPTIKIDNVQPARQGLWTKVVGAFKYIHKHHRDSYDWVVRADDDTHAIMDNMREMLLPYSPNKPGFFGSLFQTQSPKGYFSGGGGVILSKEALDRVVNGAFDNKHRDCHVVNSSHSVDDVNIGQCLYAVGVVPDDSRDFKGRSRMHCFDVESHLNPDVGKKDWWYWMYLYWNIKGGLECCGENGIAWHYIPPHRQYLIQFLAYNVQVENVVTVTTANLTNIFTRPPTTTYQPRYTKDGKFVD